MDCRMARKLIPHAADGGLDDHEIEHLHSHLSSCPSCANLLESHRAAIRMLEDALHTAAGEIFPPANFASIVAMKAAQERSAQPGRIFSLWERVAHIQAVLARSRRIAVAGIAAALLAVSLATAGIFGRAIDSSPVATTKVYSGHLITFTIKPRPDGSVEAGVDARRYCQIRRARGETLR
ncbi:MAG: zf-HC2 domain-containing protein [Armatimonadetes bacterium]|nr:zf-HC2 domain-containing protein [Armatimonadota bacterium]